MRDQRRIRLALGVTAAALAAVAGAAAGCGGSSDPTHAEYVATADGVCKDSGKALDAIEVEYAKDPDPNRPQRYVRAKIVPEYEKMTSTLRSIDTPTDDGPYLSDLYDDLTRRVADLQRSPTGGRDKVRGDEELQQRFARYGMKVCGRV